MIKVILIAGAVVLLLSVISGISTYGPRAYVNDLIRVRRGTGRLAFSIGILLIAVAALVLGNTNFPIGLTQVPAVNDHERVVRLEVSERLEMWSAADTSYIGRRFWEDSSPGNVVDYVAASETRRRSVAAVGMVLSAPFDADWYYEAKKAQAAASSNESGYFDSADALARFSELGEDVVLLMRGKVIFDHLRIKDGDSDEILLTQDGLSTLEVEYVGLASGSAVFEWSAYLNCDSFDESWVWDLAPNPESHAQVHSLELELAPRDPGISLSSVRSRFLQHIRFKINGLDRAATIDYLEYIDESDHDYLQTIQRARARWGAYDEPTAESSSDRAPALTALVPRPRN